MTVAVRRLKLSLQWIGFRENRRGFPCEFSMCWAMDVQRPFPRRSRRAKPCNENYVAQQRIHTFMYKTCVFIFMFMVIFICIYIYDPSKWDIPRPMKMPLSHHLTVCRKGALVGHHRRNDLWKSWRWDQNIPGTLRDNLARFPLKFKGTIWEFRKEIRKIRNSGIWGKKQIRLLLTIIFPWNGHFTGTYAIFRHTQISYWSYIPLYPYQKSPL
jgi:hypothetical protein